MKNVKAIELQFENCEVIQLPFNVLGNVYLGPISTEIARIASNAICEINSISDVALEIFSEANELGGKIAFFNENKTILERIYEYDDITHINIIYDDDSSVTYSVDYLEEGGCLGARNTVQKSMFSKLGNLYIVISRTKCLSDYFVDEELNDEEYVNSRKEMYGIGE
jgi:hypothetical protein